MALSKSYQHDVILAHSWHGKVLEKTTAREGGAAVHPGVILKIALVLTRNSRTSVGGTSA